MLKALQRLIIWLAQPVEAGSQADPLAHPLIERMTERQIADLPLAPDARKKAGPNACPA
ncbi:MAG: hypothetical protein KL863_12490 [Rhizobium sp.]|nr:hypothetical protein [Rhizobium sp.]